jgi:hypothetical protein
MSAIVQLVLLRCCETAGEIPSGYGAAVSVINRANGVKRGWARSLQAPRAKPQHV